jgi:hypothetical protein
MYKVLACINWVVYALGCESTTFRFIGSHEKKFGSPPTYGVVVVGLITSSN